MKNSFPRSSHKFQTYNLYKIIINTYQVNGAGCKGCLKTIVNRLNQLKEVKLILEIDLNSVTIQFKGNIDFVSISYLNKVFEGRRFFLSKVPHVINFVLISNEVLEEKTLILSNSYYEK
jgi:hypothetical protein